MEEAVTVGLSPDNGIIADAPGFDNLWKVKITIPFVGDFPRKTGKTKQNGTLYKSVPSVCPKRHS